jgi:hypothetical protein
MKKSSKCYTCYGTCYCDYTPLRITRFEIEIKDKGWKKDPKIRSLYIFLYCVKHFVNKMKKKRTSSKINYL